MPREVQRSLCGGGVMASQKDVKAYLAKIGSKGGKAKGSVKARSPEHYKRLADMKRAKKQEKP